VPAGLRLVHAAASYAHQDLQAGMRSSQGEVGNWLDAVQQAGPAEIPNTT
jgi:hypothetical protein